MKKTALFFASAASDINSLYMRTTAPQDCARCRDRGIMTNASGSNFHSMRLSRMLVRGQRCSFQNGGPARNFGFHQPRETRRGSFLLGGNRSTQLRQSLPD